MKKRGIMVRADRLLSILLLLQNHGKMTSRELARRLEVSERTIFRDMEALCTAGIPVYADRGSTGGWALTEGYRTRLTGMKAQELMSLLLMNSSSLVDDLGLRGEFDSACLKLLAASPAELRRDAEVARERIHVDGAGWHQTSESSTYLPVVQEAVWEERTLRIEYERHDGDCSRRAAEQGHLGSESDPGEIQGAVAASQLSMLEPLWGTGSRPEEIRGPSSRIMYPIDPIRWIPGGCRRSPA